MRFQTATSAPSRSRAQTTARAAPPAPSTSARLPAGEAGSASSRAVGVGVLGADLVRRRRPACWRRRSRARSRRARRRAASAAPLCGTVTLAPTKPSARHRPHPRLEGVGSDLDRLVAPLASQPQLGQRRGVHRRRARVADRVAEDGEARHDPIPRSCPASCRRPLRGPRCSVRRRRSNSASVEEKASLSQAARFDHVVEVVDLGRVRGGFDRGEAGAADRPRRQAGVGARVVGRFDRQFGFGQRLACSCRWRSGSSRRSRAASLRGGGCRSRRRPACAGFRSRASCSIIEAIVTTS